MEGQIEKDVQLVRELLMRLSDSRISELVETVRSEKLSNLQSLITRYIQKLRGCSQMTCDSITWDIHDGYFADWYIELSFDDPHSIRLSLVNDELMSIEVNDFRFCARDTRNIFCLVCRHYGYPSEGVLNGIQSLLGLSANFDLHVMEGSLNTEFISYCHRKVFDKFDVCYSFYIQRSIYTVLLIYKHCPESQLARLSKDLLRYMLNYCF